MQEISKYIDQLVDDIQFAMKRNGNTVSQTINSDWNQDFDEFNSATHITKSLSGLTGIEKLQFPSASHLTENQSEKLVSHIMELLAVHRIYSDFPNLLPAKKRYKLICDYWDKEVTLKGKDHHIDFCHYSLDNCPYQGYCTICDELKDE